MALDTLGNVLREYAVNRTIDWIKVDVEGHERQVLEGMDWSFRPRAWVIEATWPGTSRPCFHLWEDILLAHDYVPALFYGINKWYYDGRRRPLRFLRPEELDEEFGAGWTREVGRCPPAR